MLIFTRPTLPSLSFPDIALLSVVIPVYNEEAVLEESLRAVHGYLLSRGDDVFEIVCVDDGSSDETPQILERLTSELALRVLTNETNLGKGGSVCRGMLAARGTHIVFTDADLSTPLHELERFLPFFDQGFDVVTGNRKNANANITVPQPWYRVYLGLGFTKLVNLVMGLEVSDYTCGFKCFSARASQDIFSRMRVSGWTFDVEILYLTRHLGYKLREVPVSWADNPNSKVRVIRAILKSFAELLRIRRDAARGVYDVGHQSLTEAQKQSAPHEES